MPTVIGVDSSTQSCKVLVVDLETGDIVSEASTSHPDGTEVNPEAWWDALQTALAQVDTSHAQAVSIGAQQHGMVALDESGSVVRPALLWNDTRSAAQAEQIVSEFGSEGITKRTGSVPLASFTATKLAWMKQNEPDLAARVAAVALPHDWLMWRLQGYGPRGESSRGPDLTALVTDRSDASGTGYFSPSSNRYDDDILSFALGHRPVLPTVLGPGERAGETELGWVMGPGGGDNAMAALGLGTELGDVVMSLGTSGTVFAVTSKPAHDASGAVAGFADATGEYLPLVATLNAARPIDAVRQLFGFSWDELADAVTRSDPGSSGLTVLPFFDGERTPNLPDAKGSLHGMTRASLTPENVTRAVVEGVIANLARGVDAIAQQTQPPSRLILIGGAAQNPGVQTVVAEQLAIPVSVPDSGEYVAYGAAKQAAWALTGQNPSWAAASITLETGDGAGIARAQFDRVLAEHPGLAD